MVGLHTKAAGVARGGGQMPAPVFRLTFDDPGSLVGSGPGIPARGLGGGTGPALPIVAGVGVGGSACLDLSGVSASTPVCPVLFSDPRLREALSGAWSFTLTCWHRRPVIGIDNESTAVVTLPGVFSVMYHPLGQAVPFLKGLTTVKGTRADLWGPTYGHSLAGDRWVFCAYTYDGTRPSDNLTAYSATLDYSVDAAETRVVSLDGGPLATPSGPVVLAALDTKGAAHLRGAMVDELRIYATRERSSEAALSPAQLDMVRREDMGGAALAEVLQEQKREELAVTLEPQRRRQQYWRGPLSVQRVDTLDNVFLDVPPVPMAYQDPLHVPRGGTVPVQFAVRSEAGTPCRVRVETHGDPALDAEVSVYELLHVPVEANNHGGSNTEKGKPPPDAWRPYLTRIAPFEVAEAMRPCVELRPTPLRYHAVLIELSVPVEARAGRYDYRVIVEAGKREAVGALSLQVHPVTLPPEPALATTLWLQPTPTDLTNGDPPKWWSDAHWTLLEAAGRTLRAFGQSAISTPTIFGEHPLIETVRRADGAPTFDFGRFDRWVTLFLGLGFRTIEGWHVTDGRGVFVRDETTGKRERLVARFKSEESLEVLALFYDALSAHLRAKGWADLYIQHQLDEPKDLDWYRRLTAVAREHLEGVRTIDAVHARRPGDYSGLVDIMAFDITRLWLHPRVADERRERGAITWLYHCCNPHPPQPNRHLDESLTSSRLYPWLAYMLKADGYLWWAANCYRGADPYRVSVGPGPRGAKPEGYVGHPPGDNWMYYPTPQGLTGSMRMVAFREGLLDHTLLTMLARSDRGKADEIMQGIARSLYDFERRPEPYHRARRELLEALGRQDD